MQNISKHIRDYIDQESRIPEINADACVHSYFNQSDCQACVDSCPSQAWVLNDESLGLNLDACNGCGQCVPACPGGALSVEYPWIIRQFKNQTIALFACELSNINSNASTLPCIHILGLRQLLLLYKFGTRHLLIATEECLECNRCPTATIQQRVEDLNMLLAERNKPPMKVLRSSDKLWQRISNSDEVISKGVKLSRRDFLRGEGQQYRRQILIDNPLNLPECRTIPPGQLLPVVNKTKVHWPWVPRLDESLCNYCDACMNLCPTNALQFIPSEENNHPEYHLNPEKCNGCGICKGVCDLKAISIHYLSPSASSKIKLTEGQCSACGNTFHFSQHASQNSEQTLCRICQKDNHSKRLFQVME
jgi:ferredoxin